MILPFFMETSLDQYYLKQIEPIQGCLLYIRQFILTFHPGFQEQLKYGVPFFIFQNKNCCYLSVNKMNQVYLGFIKGKELKHAKLKSEGRKLIKVFYLDPTKDIDLKSLNELFELNVKVIQKSLKIKK